MWGWDPGFSQNEALFVALLPAQQGICFTKSEEVEVGSKKAVL